MSRKSESYNSDISLEIINFDLIENSSCQWRSKKNHWTRNDIK